jgi:hypothetical protein
MSSTPGWVPLNPLNQLMPRAYNRVVLCFEIDNDNQGTAVKFLESCVVKLGTKRPILTALLKTDTPIVLINDIGCHNIPVEVINIKDEFRWTYSHLRENRFPASHFVHKIFEVPMTDIAPALIIRIYLIDGGIILGIHLNHLLGDGQAIDNVISWLSAETRGDPYTTSPIVTSPPFSEIHDPSEGSQAVTTATLDQTIPHFPERELNSTAYSEAPREKCLVKNFLIDISKLDKLRTGIEKREGVTRPTAAVTVAALAWAHATKARLTAFAESSVSLSINGAQTDDEKGRLFLVMDVRKRAFDKERADHYFGNAVEAVAMSIPMTDLLMSCGDNTDTEVDTEAYRGPMVQRLGSIIRFVKQSIAVVDKEYVLSRYRQYAQLSDPRELRLTHSRRDVRDFMINSWRYFGLNPHQKWKIPGLIGDGYPDKLCRAMGECDFPAAMIMPTAEASQVIDLMIVLEESAMESLMKDQAFMSLVKNVID